MWKLAGDRRTFGGGLLALCALLLGGACLGDGGPAGPPRVSLNVLFIGNSLTYVNDLPATLSNIAGSVGDTISVAMVAGPKLTLASHLQTGSAAEVAIQGGGWDFVVLQEGADADDAGRQALILAAEQFDTLIRAVGARPALYMVWPTADMPQDFGAAGDSYFAAADAVNGLFLPAGLAWQSAFGRDSTIVLYDPDGAHPSPLGTYLAAITIYGILTGHDPRLLPGHAVVNGAQLSTPTATVRLLQTVAHEVDTQYPPGS